VPPLERNATATPPGRRRSQRCACLFKSYLRVCVYATSRFELPPHTQGRRDAAASRARTGRTHLPATWFSRQHHLPRRAAKHSHAHATTPRLPSAARLYLPAKTRAGGGTDLRRLRCCNLATTPLHASAPAPFPALPYRHLRTAAPAHDALHRLPACPPARTTLPSTWFEQKEGTVQLRGVCIHCRVTHFLLLPSTTPPPPPPSTHTVPFLPPFATTYSSHTTLHLTSLYLHLPSTYTFGYLRATCSRSG